MRTPPRANIRYPTTSMHFTVRLPKATILTGLRTVLPICFADQTKAASYHNLSYCLVSTLTQGSFYRNSSHFLQPLFHWIPNDKINRDSYLFSTCVVLFGFFTRQAAGQRKPPNHSKSLGINVPWRRFLSCLLYLVPRVSQLSLLWRGLGGKATRKCGLPHCLAYLVSGCSYLAGRPGAASLVARRAGLAVEA